jgi:hypothetical protein
LSSAGKDAEKLRVSTCVVAQNFSSGEWDFKPAEAFVYKRYLLVTAYEDLGEEKTYLSG